MASFKSSAAMRRVLIAAVALTALLTWQAEAGRLAPRNLLQVASSACPSDPSTLCDFRFDGYASSVPVISLDGPADVNVGPAVVEGRNGTLVQISNVGTGNVLAGCPATLNSTSVQFYISDSPSKVHFRNFNVNKTFFSNLCVVLPLLHINVAQLNLSPGDNSTLYPEARRCVVFQTGPTGSQCQSPPLPPAKTTPPLKKTPPPPLKKTPPPPLKKTPPPPLKKSPPPPLKKSPPPPLKKSPPPPLKKSPPPPLKKSPPPPLKKSPLPPA